MAKLEYRAECLCGGELKCFFRKPTQMQPYVSRTTCSGCGSEFMLTCTVGANENGRYYKTDHEVTKMTVILKQKLKQKKEASDENNTSS